ncbi:MAG: hypothetical protein KDN22_22870 [Verrucomicrobiae bacterium]|nr:hypothetical protein [Verrucomicrobiae bacterium]
MKNHTANPTRRSWFSLLSALTIVGLGATSTSTFADDEDDSLVNGTGTIKAEALETQREIFNALQNRVGRGNAKQTVNRIENESKEIRDRIARVREEIGKTEESCIEAGYEILDKTRSFTHEQKRAQVDKFRHEAAAVFVTFDRELQIMLYTYRNSPTVVKDAKIDERLREDADPAARGNPERSTTAAARLREFADDPNPPDSASEVPDRDLITERDPVITGEGNVHQARDLIEKEAALLRKQLDKTAKQIEEAAEEAAEAVHAALEKDEKFRYIRKHEYSHQFKKQVATILANMHAEVCELLPKCLKQSTPELLKGASRGAARRFETAVGHYIEMTPSAQRRNTRARTSEITDFVSLSSYSCGDMPSD